MKKLVVVINVAESKKSIRSKSGDGLAAKGIDLSAVLRTTVLASLGWVVHKMLSVFFG